MPMPDPGNIVGPEWHGAAALLRASRRPIRIVDPIRAAGAFVADYDAILAELTSEWVEPSIARSLARIASVGAEPRASARKLLENFETVLRLAKKTHPSVARSIALSACSARDPLDSARLYHEELRPDREGCQSDRCATASPVSSTMRPVTTAPGGSAKSTFSSTALSPSSRGRPRSNGRRCPYATSTVPASSRLELVAPGEGCVSSYRPSASVMVAAGPAEIPRAPFIHADLHAAQRFTRIGAVRRARGSRPFPRVASAADPAQATVPSPPCRRGTGRGGGG